MDHRETDKMSFDAPDDGFFIMEGEDPVEIFPLRSLNYPMLSNFERSGFQRIKEYLSNEGIEIWMTEKTWDQLLGKEIMRNGGSTFLESFRKIHSKGKFKNYFLTGNREFHEILFTEKT